MSVDLIRQIVDHVVGETLIGGRKSGAMVADGETAGSIEQFKTLLAEKLRTAGGSPGSSSGTSYLVWDAAYQNSAMSSPVGAYLYKDADGVIWQVYEPSRNNVVSRSVFSYADTIDLFPFDNEDCFNNFWSDNKLIDVENDVMIQNCWPLQNMVIDGGGFSGLVLKKITGVGGYFLPDDYDINIEGNDVVINNVVFNGGAMFNVGAESTFEGVQMGYGSAIGVNGFKIRMNSCRLEEQADVWVVSSNTGNPTAFLNCSFKQLCYVEGTKQEMQYVTAEPNANVTAGRTSTDSITAVNQGTKTFTVSGDQTAKYITGTPIRIQSGANRKYYTVSTSSYDMGDDATEIIVDETIPSPVVAGAIHALILANTINNSQFGNSCTFKPSAENLDFDGVSVAPNLNVNTSSGFSGANIINVAGAAYLIGESTGSATLTAV